MKKVILLTSCILLLICTSRCTKKEFDVFATIYGTVIDASNGEPISNVNVSIVGGESKTTKTDGSYEFSKLDARSYTITASKLGYQNDRKSRKAEAGERIEVNFQLIKE